MFLNLKIKFMQVYGGRRWRWRNVFLITYSELRWLDKLNFRWHFCVSFVIFNSKIENIYFFFTPKNILNWIIFQFWTGLYVLRCGIQLDTQLYRRHINNCFFSIFTRLVISQWTWNKTYHRVSICLIYGYFTGKGHWW